MIEYVDDLCKVWARELGRGQGASCSGVWGRIIAGGLPGGSTAGILPLSSDAIQVEAAIIQLGKELKEVVLQQYLGKGNSIESAQVLRISKKRYYDLLDCAHIDLDSLLTPSEEI